MTLKECYKILGLSNNAGLDDVKSAYRKLAFSLHPDLNSNNPNASLQFQKVNEAYVLLSKNMAVTFGSSAFSANKEQQSEATPKHEWYTGNAKGGKGKPKTQWTWNFNQKTQSKQEQNKQEQATTSSTKDFESDSFKSTFGMGFESSSGTGVDVNNFKVQSAEKNAYVKQEEVLEDILNDPFARRVFEDIYRESVRTGKQQPEEPLKPKKTKKKKISLEWGDNRVAFDFSDGIRGAVKKWLRRQIDDDQTVYVPAVKLRSGARLRLQIGIGMSDETQTIEVTLPPNYVPGKPIRLKGLGRKIGSWRGDLYLRIEIKENAKE